MEPRRKQPRGVLKGQNESNLICWKLGFTSRTLAGRERANYWRHPSSATGVWDLRAELVRDITAVSVSWRLGQALFQNL